MPIFNDTERLRLCLDALQAQDYPSDRFEVIVVDNGSDEPPRELVERRAGCRFAEEAKPGSYAARNKGLSLATGKVLAFTDSDCIPQPQWLSEGVRTLLASNDVGLVGGRIEVFPADPQAPTAVELYDCLFGLRQDIHVSRYHFAATANAFTRAKTMEKLGGFNEELKSGGDHEFGNRVAEASLGVVFAPSAVIRHPARREMSDLMRQARRHAGGRIDKRKAQTGRTVKLRDIRNALRLMTPPLKKMREAAAGVRKRGHGWGSVLQVWGVIMSVQYSQLWAGARAALGFGRERR